MAKNSLAKSLFAFAACAFIVVGAVAGIKYVVEGGSNDDGSIYIPPSTSDRPTTSEEPQIEVMPAALLDGDYEDFITAFGQTSLYLSNEGIKPDGMSASSYGNYDINLEMLIGSGDAELIPFKANSARWSNTTSSIVLGFSDTSILNKTYEEFYTNGVSEFKYASALIFDFTLNIEEGITIYPYNRLADVSLFYRINPIDGWYYFGITSEENNAFEITKEDINYDGGIQFALVYQSNNKSTRVEVVPDIELHPTFTPIDMPDYTYGIELSNVKINDVADVRDLYDLVEYLSINSVVMTRIDDVNDAVARNYFLTFIFESTQPDFNFNIGVEFGDKYELISIGNQEVPYIHNQILQVAFVNDDIQITYRPFYVYDLI